MSATREDIGAVLRADAREHGVRLRFDVDSPLPSEVQERERIAETLQGAVHDALHGVALAQVGAGEVVVKVGASHNHKVDVAASLRD